MFFGRCQNENGVCRRFFQCFQKRVERLRRQHMHLVDDEHLVFSDLRRDANLLNERADMLHAVVRSRIKFKNAERGIFGESRATRAGSAGLVVGGRGEAVQHFGEDAGVRGFAHTARAAKQERVRDMAARNGVFQRLRNMLLTNHLVEFGGAILAGRYDKIAHRGEGKNYGLRIAGCGLGKKKGTAAIQGGWQPCS